MTHIPNNLNAIVHIGAGVGEELPVYLASDADHILLVEPNPIMAEALRKQGSTDARVQVVELAITDDPALGVLTEYNIPEAASLYQPTELQKLYPSLRAIAHHKVAAKSPQWLLQHYPLKGQYNMLVIQAPGAEMAIIQSLVNSDQIDSICTIDLIMSEKPYYAGAFSSGDVVNLLTIHGYNVEKKQNQNPDWQRYMLKRDPKAQKIVALQSELNTIKTRLQESERKAQELQADKLESEKDVKNKENRIKQLEEKLCAAEKSEQALTDIKRQMEYLFEQNSLQLEQIVNSLGKHIPTTLRSSANKSERLEKDKSSDTSFLVPWDRESIKGAVEAWAKGNWESLTKLDNAELPEKADREYLAILAAAGHQYSADYSAEDRCISLALQWGVTKQQIKIMMLSGIYNRLGRASVLSGDHHKAVEYFSKSLSTSIFSIEIDEQTMTDRIQTQLSDMPKEDLDKTLSLL